MSSHIETPHLFHRIVFSFGSFDSTRRVLSIKQLFSSLFGFINSWLNIYIRSQYSLCRLFFNFFNMALQLGFFLEGGFKDFTNWSHSHCWGKAEILVGKRQLFAREVYSKVHPSNLYNMVWVSLWTKINGKASKNKQICWLRFTLQLKVLYSCGYQKKTIHLSIVRKVF